MSEVHVVSITSYNRTGRFGEVSEWEGNLSLRPMTISIRFSVLVSRC